MGFIYSATLIYTLAYDFYMLCNNEFALYGVTVYCGLSLDRVQMKYPIA